MEEGLTERKEGGREGSIYVHDTLHHTVVVALHALEDGAEARALLLGYLFRGLRERGREGGRKRDASR